MASIVVAPQQPGRPADGTALSALTESAVLNAPTDHWEIDNNGRVLIQLINTHATQVAAFTLETPLVVDGNAVADRDYTVAAARRTEMLGPWSPDTYGATLTITATAQGTKRIAVARF